MSYFSLRGEEKKKKKKKKGLFPACCLMNNNFSFLSYATALPAHVSACDKGGHTVSERHRAQRSSTKLKAELPEG